MKLFGDIGTRNVGKTRKRKKLVGILTWVIVLIVICVFSVYGCTKYLFATETPGSPNNPGIYFMAADKDPDGNYVLYDHTTNTAKVSLGRWTKNVTKTYPAALAVVNTQLSGISIRKIEVTGDVYHALRIYLHKDPDMPCNSTIIPYEIRTESEEDMQPYYEGYASIDWESNGWKLGKGLGCGDTGCPIYTDDGSKERSVNATWDDICNVWVYKDMPPCGSNIADNGTANFVWVEIDVVMPPNVSRTTVNGEITFHFQRIAE